MVEHYFTERPTSRVQFFLISATLRNRVIEFYSAPGVFSKKRVDLGTRLLINKCIIKPNSSILDLGCGYGAVGITIAKFFRSTQVLLSDVNRRAVLLSRKNKAVHKLQNARVTQSDVFKRIPQSFDHILLNPPQTAGKKLCFRMIEEAKEHLHKKGTLQLVARHNKGGKTLSEKMKQVFGNVITVAKKSGYRIYSSEC